VRILEHAILTHLVMLYATVLVNLVEITAKASYFLLDLKIMQLNLNIM
jgi:hypothetical protein